MTIIARSLLACATTVLVAPAPLFIACSSNTDTPAGTGGSVATGGAKATGGVIATGGVLGTGGVVTTGGTVATGGSATGGAATGGTATGGVNTGGSATGGSLSAGTGGQGGAGTGGASGAGGSSAGAGGGSSGAGGIAGSAGGGQGGVGGRGTAGGGAGGAGSGGGGAAGGGAGGGGAGGAGGATCGTLGKATDGSYVRTGWTGEYTCTGTCPAKNQADMGDVATRAFDGNYQTRWSTGVYQSALKQQNKFPLFFTVDMKSAVPISKLTTHPGCQDIFDSPGTIEVQVSTDGTNFTTVTAMPHTPAAPPNEACPPNMNSVAIDAITFPTTCARYVRLKGTQRTTSDRYWAIGELNVYP